MKISIFSLEVWALMAEFHIDRLGALKRAAELGITALDIDANEFNETYTIPSLLPMLQETGIAVSAVYGFCPFADRDETVFQDSIASGKHYIDIAVQLGTKNLMIVPVFGNCISDSSDKSRARDRICEGYLAVMGYAAKNGVTVSVEDFSQSTAPLAFSDDLQYLFSSVPALRFTFDTGNFRCLDVDVLESYSVLRDYICHVHLKDWQLNGDFPSYFVATDGATLYGCALGDGFIPIGTLLEKLRESGYDGYVCIEHNFITNSEALIKRSVAFVKRYIG